MALEKPLTDRTLPYSSEAELAVLGSILLNNDTIPQVVEIIADPKFFSSDTHAKIFETVLALFDKNHPVTLVTLAEELKKRGWFEEIGGNLFLASLMERVISSANIEYHARIVLEKAILRLLISTSTQIVSMAYRETDDVESILNRAEEMIFSISAKRFSQGFVPIKSIIRSSFETIQELCDRKDHLLGLETGYLDLDTMTSGLQKSEMIVIAGRPGMGKTSFALNIAQYIAIERHLPVAVFTIEMSKEALVQRLLCSEARVNAHKVRTGYISHAEWPQLTTAAGLLADAPIYIDDTPGLSCLEMRAKARRLKAEKGIEIVIVDYLQLINPHRRAENRQQEISQISRDLKALAKELDIPVLALSQLSREVEKRGDRRPQLSDLRESGAIEQDADLVLFLYRPWIYSKDPDDEGTAELIVAKQRNGPVGTIRLSFIKEYMRFENLAGPGMEPSAPIEYQNGGERGNDG
jgi:replicative DNA helicase